MQTDAPESVDFVSESSEAVARVQYGYVEQAVADMKAALGTRQPSPTPLWPTSRWRPKRPSRLGSVALSGGP